MFNKLSYANYDLGIARRLLTSLSFLKCDVRQEVMTSDNPQKLEHVLKVGLVTATLALQCQQEISSAPDAATLVLVNHIHEQKRQYSNVPMSELGSDDIKHAVQRVQPMRLVHRFLGPRLKTPRSFGYAGVDQTGRDAASCCQSGASGPPRESSVVQTAGGGAARI